MTQENNKESLLQKAKNKAGTHALKPFMKEGQRLTRILESIDTDLKNIASGLNVNLKVINNNIKELDAKLDKLINEKN